MCGICGLVFRDPRVAPARETLARMAATIRHRGPDDQGIEVLGSAGLAHLRLSILDLSPAGHQPMSNEDGTVWIVFNGEVYNFPELRKDLESRHHFRSHTDTEVLIHLYEERGPAMVELLDGMFAFAILDTNAQRLFLARDPFGIKPLYYALDDRRFVFGSEIKALLASGEVSRDLDPGALNDFFDFHWIPAPRSIFSQVRKLPPAHTLEIDLRRWTSSIARYWRPEYRPEQGRSLDDWADEAEVVLNRSVAAQMVSDVPLGAFLSGGIDSSLVCRGAALASPQALRTFTIDFEDSKFSEAQYARQVADALHTEAIFRTVQAGSLDSLGPLAEFYDEPFADSSLLPTFAVSRVTREHVTVALSGDGGDELFSGYWHYFLASRLSRLDRVPTAVNRLLFGTVAAIAPKQTRVHDWGRRFALSPDMRRLSVIRLPGRAIRSQVLSPDLRENREQRFWHLRESLPDLQGLPPVTQTQFYDLMLYLPSDMLVKVDRASMAHSLEVRVPFLSKSVADLAFRIPEETRFEPECDKRVLRRLVARHFGESLAYREKKGFGVPLRRWMQDVARGPEEEQLLASPAVRSGILDARGIRRLFAALRRPDTRFRTERSDELFALLCFTAWWRRYQG